jgi:SET domain-containing protein
LVILALRTILPGEEITYDYGKDYVDSFIKPVGCRCAACAAKAWRRRRRKGASQAKARRPHRVKA